MSKIAIKGATTGTGTFTIESPATNTDRTLVLPDAAGDVVLTTATQTLTNKSISAAQINSGTLGVARGGTGASTLTANNVLLGNGTSALQAVAPGTSGNVLTSNGTTWTSAAPAAAAPVVNTFNSNGTWTKPSTGTMARIQVWGGGGGGSRFDSSTTTTGGGGGGYNEIVVPLSTLGATVSVTVGAGGAGRTGSDGVGVGGGQTSFGSHCTAYGGAGGDGFGDWNLAGGGGPLSAGFRWNGSGSTFASRYGSPTIPSQVAVDIGAMLASQTPFHGAMSVAKSSTPVVFNGMEAIYGGGAGGSAAGTNNSSGGVSVFGGAGGNGGRSTTGINGTAPGGGGGGRNNSLNGGNGAAGRVIVTVW